MYYKISPVIIVILVVVVIAIAGLGIGLFMNNNKGSVQEELNSVSDVVPTLNLNVNTEEENQESVTITAVASIEDEGGISSITLPDGTINRSDTATYEVTKNGSYTFKTKGNNGQTTSLTIEINNIREASSTSPYIPTGFSHVDGEIDTGFVIEDQYGNQFVWVPVPDGKLTSNTMLDTDYEDNASVLVNSVAQNYGFYIARYEASAYSTNGGTVAASMGNKTPWVNVTYIDAVKAASSAASAFGYEGYQTALINSYAWDTTLAWLNQSTQNYSSNTSYGNYSGNVQNTGGTETDIKNNICDMAGNVREWTTEIYKKTQKTTTNTSSSKNSKKSTANVEVASETVNYRVIRGGSASLSRTASSHTGYQENTGNEYWGFRMILYK